MARKRRNRDKPAVANTAQEQQHQRQLQHFRAQIEASSGPLPPPEVLERYSQVVTDGAERIMVMAEKQNDHRIRQEDRVITEDIRRQRWGLGLGFVIAVVGLAAASYIGVYGNAVVGGVVAGGDLVALAGVFVYGSMNRSQERGQRVQRMTGQR